MEKRLIYTLVIAALTVLVADLTGTWRGAK
jgi:hypothetical protein